MQREGWPVSPTYCRPHSLHWIMLDNLNVAVVLMVYLCPVLTLWLVNTFQSVALGMFCIYFALHCKLPGVPRAGSLSSAQTKRSLKPLKQQEAMMDGDGTALISWSEA